MKFIIYFIVLITLCSCYGETSEQNNFDSKQLDKDSIKVNDRLHPILDTLEKYGVMHDQFIGESSIVSGLYIYFEKLMEIATDEELIDLTNHSTPSIRGYAFWALAKKKNPKVKEIMLDHISDSESFSLMSGCLLTQEQVNTFFLDVLTPLQFDYGCLKLTESEIEEIRSKINVK